INFANFEVAIKVRYSINLIGWLEGIPFQSPHAITNAKHLWTLHDALKAGTCHWAYMTRQQLELYQDQLKEQQSTSEVVGKPRKKCSNVGRKQRHTVPGRGLKSAAIINLSSEEDTSLKDDM
ncbi:hypothetical protein EDD15DRAFT_2170299, partial [Pisolithus albus]